MNKLTKLGDRILINLENISYIDLERKLDATGPSYIKAKVVVAGHLVILNESESSELINKLLALGKYE